MPRIVSGDDLDQMARGFERDAADIQGVRDDLRHETDKLVWEGGARRTYGHKLGQQLSDIVHAADRLQDAAKQLHRLADDCRTERARLNRLQQEVFEAVGRSREPSTFLIRKGVTGPLPDRWDPAWVGIHRLVCGHVTPVAVPAPTR